MSGWESKMGSDRSWPGWEMSLQCGLCLAHSLTPPPALRKSVEDETSPLFPSLFPDPLSGGGEAA